MANGKSGLFPACFHVSRDEPGSETATFKWLVNGMQGTVSGTGQVTQAINPPTDVTVEMTGHFQEQPNGEILVVAGGARPGAAVQVVLKLESWKGPGEALTLRWLANGHYFSDDNVPAKSISCFPN